MTHQARNERVIELTSLMIDDALSADQQAELNGLLRGDPEACEVYLDVIDSHSSMLHQSPSAGAATFDLPFVSLAKQNRDANRPPNRSEPQRTSTDQSCVTDRASRTSWLAVAASLVLAASVLIAVAMLRRDASTPPVAQNKLQSSLDPATAEPKSPSNTAPLGIAVLSRIVNPQWGQDQSYKEGQMLMPGRIQLASGLAQLDFFSGASMIVEGPADLQLHSAWRARCNEGKIRVCVPEPAQGFTIETADYEAVDLGTEFAMRVSQNESEVHVLTGEVQLDDRQGNEIDNLKTGDGLHFAGKTPRTIDANADGFVGREVMMLRSINQSSSRFARWQTAQQELSQDPSLIVQFDFEDQNSWDYQLRNSRVGGPHGAIIGADWISGRWPEKKALEFKRLTDRVRINIPGTFEQLTLATWVRVESFDRWLSSLILTDGFDRGEVHWQISDEGELILGIGKARPLNTFTPPVIRPADLGRWLHLAVTVDRSTRQVIHYLSGQEISRHTLQAMPELKFGQAEIGNWAAEARHDAIRTFNGRMDEFLIFKRALAADEIKRLASN